MSIERRLQALESMHRDRLTPPRRRTPRDLPNAEDREQAQTRLQELMAEWDAEESARIAELHSRLTPQEFEQHEAEREAQFERDREAENVRLRQIPIDPAWLDTPWDDLLEELSSDESSALLLYMQEVGIPWKSTT